MNAWAQWHGQDSPIADRLLHFNMLKILNIFKRGPLTNTLGCVSLPFLLHLPKWTCFSGDSEPGLRLVRRSEGGYSLPWRIAVGWNLANQGRPRIGNPWVNTHRFVKERGNPFNLGVRPV